MASLPGISVIIATRNRVRYLATALDSVLEQDYPDLEVVIVDGGSTDGTVDLLKSYRNKIGPWVSEPDGGEYFALNKALILSTKEVVKLMTDDDQMRPDSLRIGGEFFSSHPDVDILFGQVASWRLLNGEGEALGEGNMTDRGRLQLRNWLLENQGVSSVTGFIRRRVFQKIGPWSTAYSCGDVEFWARAARAGVTMDVVPDVLIDYCLHGENGIIRKRSELIRDMIKICWRYGGLLFMGACILRYWLLPPVGTALGSVGIHPLRFLRRLRGSEKAGAGNYLCSAFRVARLTDYDHVGAPLTL